LNDALYEYSSRERRFGAVREAAPSQLLDILHA